MITDEEVEEMELDDWDDDEDFGEF